MVRVGDKHSRMSVTGIDGKWAICRCDCGNIKRVRAIDLERRGTRSCGCLREENRTKHGMRWTKEYGAWGGMKARCNAPSTTRYERYGGRGITVCQAWSDSFEAFYVDVGPAPSEDHSIDRIDNNGNYEIGNVRWATRKEQSANKGNVECVELKGISKTTYEWCDLLGIVHRGTFRSRKSRGWNTMRALLTRPRPLGPKHLGGKPITDEELDEILKEKCDDFRE